MNKSVKPTFEQQLNLLKLAKGLLSLPERYKHFDMSGFFNTMSGSWYGGDVHYPREVNKPLYKHCGTIACMVGHGPMFGMEGVYNESWVDYSHRVFGIAPDKMEWEYLFSGEWEEYDNTILGGVKRIVTFLENDCKAPKKKRNEYWWGVEA